MKNCKTGNQLHSISPLIRHAQQRAAETLSRKPLKLEARRQSGIHCNSFYEVDEVELESCESRSSGPRNVGGSLLRLWRSCHRVLPDIIIIIRRVECVGCILKYCCWFVRPRFLHARSLHVGSSRDLDPSEHPQRLRHSR